MSYIGVERFDNKTPRPLHWFSVLRYIGVERFDNKTPDHCIDSEVWEIAKAWKLSKWKKVDMKKHNDLMKLLVENVYNRINCEQDVKAEGRG